MSSLPTDRGDANGIDCSARAGETVIALRGDIDAALREQASAAMVFLVSQDQPVVLDTGAVTFIDSSGLAFLVQVYKVCEESSLGLVLLDPPENLLDLLEMLGMGDRFTIERSGSQESVTTGA
ncbi:STAS domain-containing protein [Sanguibacter sp. 25GB23B1]|uniref:STAS domain-containing protein n=1 Tax=unclassified Sanguibacter TaxID=2645534 RepID=UPI0032AFC4DA